MREYGRHIQRMINHAVSIKDDEERQAVAEIIINMMAQLNPQVKTTQDYRQKLWDHLFIMSDFKLEVNSPYPKPTLETAYIQPTPMAYPKHNMRFRHYGKNVETMVKKAMLEKDPEKRKAFIEMIAGYMKLAYRNWSFEEVNDELIKEDIKTLSKGELVITDEMKIEATAKINITQAKNSSNGRKKNNNYKKNNRNNKNRNYQNRNKRYK